MEESREQGIKLFGMTIPLRRREEGPMITGHGGGGESDEDLQRIHSRTQDGDSPNSPEKSELTSREPQNPQANQDTRLTSKLEDQTPKKPEEILPCPRCNNRDTKFCYFNNYNLNQPRHFCKNCQRYWTAGGSMRNVPIGAGRRKKKCSASHYNQIIQAVQSDHLKPNGTVLNFGSQFESIDCVINPEEKTREEEHMATHPENGDENPTASSRTTSSVTDEGAGSNMQEPAQLNHQGFFPCFNGSPLPYPWNPAPAFCTTSFPIPFYPAYWGCTVPGDWSFPWLTPLAPSPNSITLGKHSRKGEVLPHLNLEQDGLEQEGRLWIPKTMRIDGPDEAATSSLWATMGFKKDKADSLPANSRFLNANPAALSRSLNFQESA